VVRKDLDDIESQDERAGGGDDTVAPDDTVVGVRVRWTVRTSSAGLVRPARTLPNRFGSWIVVHPIRWAIGSGVLLVLLGLALSLEPIVVVGAGAALGLINALHARKRGYCPWPTGSGSRRRE
jgi:hypothetical protein